MSMTKKNVNRQKTHEEIRVLSHQAAKTVKEEGQDNDLMERIRRSDFFKPIAGELDEILDPRQYVGRSPQQVDRFLGPGGEVQGALEKYEDVLRQRNVVDLNV